MSSSNNLDQDQPLVVVDANENNNSGNVADSFTDKDANISPNGTVVEHSDVDAVVEEQHPSRERDDDDEEEEEEFPLFGNFGARDEDYDEESDDENVGKVEQDDAGLSPSSTNNLNKLEQDVMLTAVTLAFRASGKREMSKGEIVDYVMNTFAKKNHSLSRHDHHRQASSGDDEASAPADASIRFMEDREKVELGIKTLVWNGLIYSNNEQDEEEETFGMADDSFPVLLEADGNNNGSSSNQAFDDDIDAEQQQQQQPEVNEDEYSSLSGSNNNNNNNNEKDNGDTADNSAHHTNTTNTDVAANNNNNNINNSNSNNNECNNNSAQTDDVPFHLARSVEGKRMLVLGLFIRNLVEQFHDSGRVSFPLLSQVERIHSQISSSPSVAAALASWSSSSSLSLTSADASLHQAYMTENDVRVIFGDLERDFKVGQIVEFAAPHSIFGPGMAQHYAAIGRNSNAVVATRRAHEAEVAAHKDPSKAIMLEYTVNPWTHAIADFVASSSLRKPASSLRSLIPPELRDVGPQPTSSLEISASKKNDDDDGGDGGDDGDDNGNTNSKKKTPKQAVEEFYFELQKAVDPDAISPGMILSFTPSDAHGKKITAESSAPAPLPRLTAEEERRLPAVLRDITTLCRDGRVVRQRIEIVNGLRRLNHERGDDPRENFRFFIDHLVERKLLKCFISSFGASQWIAVPGRYTLPDFANKAVRDVAAPPSGISLSIDVKRILGTNTVLPYSAVVKCLSWLGWTNSAILSQLMEHSIKLRAFYKVFDPRRAGKGQQNMSYYIAPTAQAQERFGNSLMGQRTVAAASTTIGRSHTLTADAAVPKATTATTSSSTNTASSRTADLPGGWNNLLTTGSTPMNALAASAASQQSTINFAAPVSASASVVSASSAPTTAEKEAIARYLEHAARYLSGRLRNFWRDLISVVPADGSIVLRSVVMQHLKSRFQWDDREERQELLDKLEERHMIGYARAMIKSDTSRIYRVVPAGNPLPPRHQRISNRIPPSAYASFITASSSPAVPNGSVSLSTSLPPPPPPPPSSSSSSAPSTTAEVITSPSSSPRATIISNFVFVDLSTTQTDFYKDVTRIVPEGTSRERGSLLSLLNMQYGWNDRDIRTSLLDDLVRKHLLRETRGERKLVVVYVDHLSGASMTLRQQFALIDNCPVTCGSRLSGNERAFLAEVMQALAAHRDAYGGPGRRQIRKFVLLSHLEAHGGFPRRSERLDLYDRLLNLKILCETDVVRGSADVVQAQQVCLHWNFSRSLDVNCSSLKMEENTNKSKSNDLLHLTSSAPAVTTTTATITARRRSRSTDRVPAEQQLQQSSSSAAARDLQHQQRQQANQSFHQPPPGWSRLTGDAASVTANNINNNNNNNTTTSVNLAPASPISVGSHVQSQVYGSFTDQPLPHPPPPVTVAAPPAQPQILYDAHGRQVIVYGSVIVPSAHPPLPPQSSVPPVHQQFSPYQYQILQPLPASFSAPTPEQYGNRNSNSNYYAPRPSDAVPSSSSTGRLPPHSGAFDPLQPSYHQVQPATTATSTPAASTTFDEFYYSQAVSFSGTNHPQQEIDRHQRRELERRSTVRLRLVPPYRSPIAFPPPMLIRNERQLARPNPSRLIFAPPPFEPIYPRQ